MHILSLAVTFPKFLKQVTAAVTSHIPDLLNKMWTELEYSYNVWDTTEGALIEHLQIECRNLQHVANSALLIFIHVSFS